jgi:hypothetical protein
MEELYYNIPIFFERIGHCINRSKMEHVVHLEVSRNNGYKN